MRRSLRIDPKGAFALQTLIAMYLHFMIYRISQRFRYFLAEVKLAPTTASIGTSGWGTVMASGFTLGNTIRKRMGLPPSGSLFSLFYQFYRLSNSHPTHVVRAYAF